MRAAIQHIHTLATQLGQRVQSIRQQRQQRVFQRRLGKLISYGLR
ncbi:MAG TPA: hypothetical protein VGE55_02165 [Limnobacter sp.]